MTTATLSVYPRAIAELLPAARQLAEQLGETPSQNELKRQLKIGTPKARDLRSALLETNPETDVDSDIPTDTAPSIEDVAQSVVVPDSPATLSRLDDPFLPLFEPVPDPPASEPAPVAEPTTPDTPVEPLALPAPAVDPVPNITASRTPHRRPSRVARVRYRVVSHGAVTGGTSIAPPAVRRPLTWPVLLLSLPAFVAIWSGWVELGMLAGFGMVRPFPGIADHIQFNSAITLPIGVETYAAYALWVWLSGRAPSKARRFAKWSALGSLVFGAAGQIAYHLLISAGVTVAPWQITSAVASLPVLVLGMGCALAHLLHEVDDAAKAVSA